MRMGNDVNNLFGARDGKPAPGGKQASPAAVLRPLFSLLHLFWQRPLSSPLVWFPRRRERHAVAKRFFCVPVPPARRSC